MNLVPFEPAELQKPLPHSDPRARHIREVLRRRESEPFDVGVINGARGKARITRSDAAGLHLEFTLESALPPPLPPITLLIGLPRPQTVRKILVETASLGVERLLFFPTERGEPAYARSTLWTSGETRRHLIAGAAQAFCTRVPELELLSGLPAALDAVSHAPTRLAMDNYESTHALSACPVDGAPGALAIGGERGWSDGERAALRSAGFILVHVGARVLRTETACVAGLALLKARLGLE